MALRRTVDLLPEIFRTDTNRKFLAATLDQLTQEPALNRTQGYVGQQFGPGVNPANNYVTEPTATRRDYQLEPGVVFLKPNTNTPEDAITYPGMIDALRLHGADVTRQDRLWESEYYTWDPFCDLDKFTNYSQYYWLPSGPDSVNVSSTNIPLTNDFTVTRSTLNYKFSDTAGPNPVITLARGGNYTFEVNQQGYNFWIQSTPGISGRLPSTPNISSRDVLGVINNGEDVGTIEFYVPLRTAQDFYYSMVELSPVDLITDLKFSSINNQRASTFFTNYPTGIDGITELNGKTLIFTNTIQDAAQGGWQIITDSGTTDITMQRQRYSVWQVVYVEDNVNYPNNPLITLQSIQEVPGLTKFRILYGSTYSTTQWYKDSSGYFQQVPLLTAVQDTLYYQDSANPEIFGEIRLVDTSNAQPIDVNEIIGAKTYTSPNGVVFTNGLKVQFRGPATPAQYQNLEYYVEGVGTGPGLSLRVGFINGEAYFGDYHVASGQKITGQTADGTFQQYIYDTIEESLANPGAGTPVGAPLPQISIPGANLGNGIKLVPVTDLVTPETYTSNELIPFDSVPYDVGAFDNSLNAPLVPDYITQNRASADRNAWSRSNRWFHIDVINYTSQLNNNTIVINNDQRARRPIIEFRANLRLWDSGTQAKTPVNVIDFAQTDALSNINGQLGYGYNGYTFLDGSRVIFAADIDPQVRNRIYKVRFVDPDNNGTLVIDLVPAVDGIPEVLQSVVSLNGATQQGVTHWFDGITWQLAQQKTSVNQPILFDVYDIQGRSFGDRNIYPSTTFLGSRLFGYADGETSVVDTVLGFSLKYLSINNVGDIVFENFLYTDTFIYVTDSTSTTVPISEGFARQYIDRVNFTSELGWQPAATTSRSRQVFRFIADSNSITLDVPVDQAQLVPPTQIIAGTTFIDPTQYTIEIVNNTTVITFTNPPTAGTIIQVLAISNQASPTAYYQVPLNLENNALNGNSNEFTLGSIRGHYDTVGQNLRELVGPINGANNSRDLGNIIPYGTKIIQNSAPLVLAGVFLRRQQYEVFNSLTFNSQEYNKYKALMLDLASRGDFVNLTPTQVLDTVTQEIAIARNQTFPFYWTDMLPAGETYTTLNYTITPITTNTFDTTTVYDLTTSNFQGLLVYLNDEILTIDRDYTVPAGTATVIISSTLTNGDVVTIREYATTYGSFVPNTPTKMGLYPAWQPKLYVDETYVQPTLVIQGHDGSITVAFGDFRDQVLLEFETRIYNNLKIHSDIPLVLTDVMPGQFRTTNYSLEEINSILLPDFLNWVGWNKLDYTTQNYVPGNPFTYNYSQSGDKLTKQPLLGAWRGIYNYFYDTITPNTTPWEMLGFSEEPTWWQEVYGPAPYTQGNLVLWEDLEAGIIADPINPRIDPKYARPGLTQVIPSGSEGALLPPLDTVVGNYDATSFRRSWVFGDDGPVENAWRTSSTWPFAVMRLLALTKPANFFSLFVDRDRYVYDTTLDQYLWDDRYRLEPTNIEPLNGDNVSVASYINWIIDYNKQRGLDSTTDLTTVLDSLDVRLCWRLGAFSDKRYLKIYTDRSTLGGSNTSLLLPDESYQLLLYQNTPFEQASYSSVVVQVVDTGWAVYGYNNLTNYFEILASKPIGLSVTIEAGGSVERVPIEYTNTVVRVPYGFVFTNRAAVCDFLYSYGELLTQRGFTFEGRENGYIMNWQQMAQEFLYWSNQGWAPGNSIINLNPGATSISVTRPGAVVESLAPSRLDSIVLNQNRTAILPNDLVIDRLDNTFKITSLTANTINFLNLRFTAFEHLMILDNRSIFADLIFDPLTASRQNRVLVSGWLSADWNGTVNAPGFVLNQANIVDWVPNRKYTKGEIVLFKDQYWSASSIIQPSANFDFNAWIKSDYSDVMQGLLPNAANASDQLASSYSVYDANLESEVDLFSYGLIGFRPRQYMQALNLDDVSQVQLYQQFLGSKGTRPSAEIFTFADLGKEIAQYDIYEYWAILRSVYGANANRSYFELLLNQPKLTSDPSLIQIIQPGMTSQADQTVFVEDIWKSSYKITSPDILPTTLTTPDNALPNAGYVSLDDVDITVFDLDDAGALDNDLNLINVGTSIWVARVNTYDWSVYRATKVPGTVTTVSDNLDAQSLLTFTDIHDLVVGDTIIIKYFSANLDGVYKVTAVPSINSVLIDYTFTGLQTSETGTGIVFTLDSSRVAQPADISLLPYARQLQPGIYVWVDNNGDNRWEVLEKTDPFVSSTTLSPNAQEELSRFGAAVAQGLNNLSALIGAPGYNPNNLTNAPGAIYSFVRTDLDQYEQNSILSLDATDTAGYGNAIDIGDQTWAVAGASASNNNQGYASTIYVRPGSNFFDQRQVLVDPTQDFNGGEFGYAVSISQNEQWLYVSSPDHGKVHAFTQVYVEPQTVSYITDGATVTYNWSNSIVINPIQPEQLTVVLDNVILEYPTDYAVSATSITLTAAPLANRVLKLSRKTGVQLDQKLYTNVTGTSSGSGTGAEFTVNNVRGLYTVDISAAGTDYVTNEIITIDQYDVDTLDSVPPAPVVTAYVTNSGTTITVADTAGIVPGMTISGTGFVLGQYVTTVVNSNNIIVNVAPTGPSGNLTFSYDIKVRVTSVDIDGAILSFDATGSGVSTTSVFQLDRYLATAVNLFAFSVRVNNVLQRPHIDYDFNSDSALLSYDIVFTTTPPPGAAILVNSDSYFDYVSSFNAPALPVEARFGQSISCNTDGSLVIVGAPFANSAQGISYVFSRSLQSFTVTDVTQTQYTTVQDLESPGKVAVSLNGVLLIPTGLNINGSYTVDVTDPTNQFVEISATLNVGDVITINTNQFTLLQIMQSDNPLNGARFGYKLDQCINDCSLYIASPYDSALALEAGSVGFLQNQSRVYGTTTSRVANPTLTAGEYISINNTFVECTGTTIEQLVDDINTADVPNVLAELTADLILEGDGSTKIFDIGSIYSDAVTYTTQVYVNNVLQTEGADYTYSNTAQQLTFVVAPYNTANITVVSGRMTLTVKNFDASTPLNRLQVLPVTGTLFANVGFTTYVWEQTIVSPVLQSEAHFGQGLFISDDTVTLIVGAPNGNMIEATIFDNNQTTFDSLSTTFSDTTQQSGAVYSFDALPAAQASAANPLQFVFGQQFVNNNLQQLDQFGTAIDYTTGVFLAGAPGADFSDSSQAEFGQVLQYINSTQSPAWKPIRTQRPVVDIALMNTVYMYDRVSGQSKEYFDYFDPLQGRVLGVVRQNLNYIGAVDPAGYNAGTLNNYGATWGQERVGQIWWDTDRVRFIDPHQDDIVYASRRWGQTFPGSEVQVYQWIVSEVPPSEYTGPGTPKTITSYTVSSSLDLQGFVTVQYYFWVTGITSVATTVGKTLSIDTIARYIDSPKSSGIPYIAPINASTVAMYNALSYISAQDTVLYVEFDKQFTEAAIHVEYQLIAQDRPEAFLNDTLYRKFLDSLSGEDIAGNSVPDPFLVPSERYGVEFRPRQSMVANRFLALQNYLTQSNTVLAQFPISEIKKFNILNSSEPEPTASSGEWDKRVANQEELSYQDLAAVPLGYKYLVVSDSNNNGLWAIYQVENANLLGARTLGLVRVQNYDTRRYWNYIDWYRPNYNQLTRILLEVPNQSALITLSVPNGSSVKVTANAQNKWEIYLLESGTWNRVGLQDGTIKISSVLWNYTLGRFGFDSEVFDAQYFDQAPVIETRKIIQAINEELFIGDLLIERNRLLILMFNFILSEQLAPAWLTKTSLIDVDHTIRELLPYQVYRTDNQDFVLDYINEVKPYHVQIREFNLKYQGSDQYLGSMTDFDLPAYYDTNQNLFISPVLDNTGTLSTTSSVPSTSPIWQTFPYNQWYQNYLLSIESVDLLSGGSNYLAAPEIVVSGDCVRQATMIAQINSAGAVTSIVVVDPGLGYSNTAIISFVSNTGTGAQAVAIMGNSMVRNIKTTIKYDRYQYSTTILTWEPNTNYDNGVMVRYANRVWEANSDDSTGIRSAIFDPSQWTLVDASTLSGVDRTMGFYVPTVNQPGLDLTQLISGVDYPGVQVAAPGFNQNTGFDVGNFDVNPYDNLSISPEGFVTYDPAILDAVYSSSFTDPFLGTLPAPAYNGNPPTTGPVNAVIVDGGEFVDTYESHAPEELVPGITYDTLDMRVFTTPGADWRGDGHGFPLADRNYVFDSGAPELDFTSLVANPVVIAVYNQTTGLELSLGVDYTINWVDYIVTIIDSASTGNIITVVAYALGGGNQLYTRSYVGDEIGNSVIVPITESLIYSFAIFVDGIQVTNYTYAAGLAGTTVISFATTFTDADRVTITALGGQDGSLVYDWSAPTTQYVVSNGSLTVTLTNSLQGTNPANLIVNINGGRARPADGAIHVGDGSTLQFDLPNSGGYSLNLVSGNEVAVYVDNVAKILGVDYTLDPADTPTHRTISFSIAPSFGAQILISVRTKAQYWVVSNQVIFQAAQGLVPLSGDMISITTWNDTAQQNILTQSFAGTPTNAFDTGRDIVNASRLIVTLDGIYLFPNEGFTVAGSVVNITGATLISSQIVVITSLAQDVVPSAMAFRIFQDMRGLQLTYRITPETSTELVQDLTTTDDIIYVKNASVLGEPELTYGIFGLITINGERITYRNRDTVNNTVSGLRRGTAGTATSDHSIGSPVYDIGNGNLLGAEYQNHIVEQNFLGNGTTSTFVATDISVLSGDSTERIEAVQVYVGGILQQGGYTLDSAEPVTVTFNTAPTAGYQVSIRVLRGQTWYNPGTNTPSDGVPLQQTNTAAARFLRGLI